MEQKENLIELLDIAFLDSDDNYGIPDREQVADYLLANGVVVLPCKVGDTVYHYCGCFDVVLPYFVEQAIVSYDVDEKETITFCANSTNEAEHELLDDIDFEPCNIGKTVFLTREEAEKALAKRKGGDER